MGAVSGNDRVVVAQDRGKMALVTFGAAAFVALAPVIVRSSRTPHGLDELVRMIEERMAETAAARTECAPAAARVDVPANAEAERQHGTRSE